MDSWTGKNKIKQCPITRTEQITHNYGQRKCIDKIQLFHEIKSKKDLNELSLKEILSTI